MNKYVYEVVDAKGNVVVGGDILVARRQARAVKRSCIKDPIEGEQPPFKIVRYELTNPTVIR